MFHSYHKRSGQTKPKEQRRFAVAAKFRHALKRRGYIITRISIFKIILPGLVLPDHARQNGLLQRHLDGCPQDMP
jgi:CRISPR/Cas system-associated protein endoribonuclease Cas2